MKDTFVLKTTIKEFSTMKECFEQEKIGKEDLIITNEFIYNSKFKEIDANVLFQERYDASGNRCSLPKASLSRRHSARRRRAS